MLIAIPQIFFRNCIAHSDYRRHGKINVEEFEDHLVFINEGAFIPETIEKALEPGYKPPYYRNAFLCNAMVNMYMIDTNSMGIPMIYNIQKVRCFPLPSYDLDVVNRVSVTIHGKVLDKNYTQLLHSKGDMDLKTVFLLDQVQKRKTISKEDYKALKKSELVEGRYPALYVSYKIAEAVGDKAGYHVAKAVRNVGSNANLSQGSGGRKAVGQVVTKAQDGVGSHPNGVARHLRRIREEEERARAKRNVEDVHTRSAENLFAKDYREGHGEHQYPKRTVHGNNQWDENTRHQISFLYLFVFPLRPSKLYSKSYGIANNHLWQHGEEAEEEQIKETGIGQMTCCRVVLVAYVVHSEEQSRQSGNNHHAHNAFRVDGIVDVRSHFRGCVRHIEEGFQSVENALEGVELASWLEFRLYFI